MHGQRDSRADGGRSIECTVSSPAVQLTTEDLHLARRRTGRAEFSGLLHVQSEREDAEQSTSE